MKNFWGAMDPGSWGLNLSDNSPFSIINSLLCPWGGVLYIYFKGNGQNYCTQTGPTILQKERWSLHVPLFPPLKRWCLVCIAPSLSGVETKKRFKPPYAISPAMRASCTIIANMKVSTQILRPINFVQTGGILHSPPTPTQGGSSSSTLVMTTSLRDK